MKASEAIREALASLTDNNRLEHALACPAGPDAWDSPYYCDCRAPALRRALRQVEAMEGVLAAERLHRSLSSCDVCEARWAALADAEREP